MGHRYLFSTVLVVLISAAAVAQSDDRILYTRITGDHASIHLSDGLGTDTLLLDSATIPQLVMEGRYLLYLKNTAINGWIGNLFNGGQWMRRTMATGSEYVMYNSLDYLVGYDMFLSDSSSAVAYACNILNNDFTNSTVLGTLTTNCDDDGPRIRQSDELVVGHNVFATLFTVERDGSARTPIPNTGSFDTWPTWSPDGEWILFSRSNSLYNVGVDYGVNVVNYYKIKLNGDSLTQLTWNAVGDSATFTSNAVWTEDGIGIIAAGTLNGRYGLMEIAADGSMLADTIPNAAGGPIHYITGTLPSRIQVGVNEPYRQDVEVRLYPNPTEGMVQVDLLGNGLGMAEVALIDPLGRQIWNGQKNLDHPFAMDLSSRGSGVYHVRMISKDLVVSIPVLKIDR